MYKGFAFALLAFTAGTVMAGERLTADELKAFFTDQTVFGTRFKPGASNVYYSPDGKVARIGANGRERTGKWWIDVDAGKRCVRWDGMHKDLCHYVERNADGTYMLVHGDSGEPLVEIRQAAQGKHL